MQLSNDQVQVFATDAPGMVGYVCELNKVMEFDHVVRSKGNGTVIDHVEGVWAPEVFDENIEEDGTDIRGRRRWKFHNDKWELMTGYTGQYSYNGPVMHPSESIGGRMAKDIKENAGLYVAVVVQTLEPEEGCEFCAEETANEGHPCPCDQHNIVGWAVAKRKA